MEEAMTGKLFTPVNVTVAFAAAVSAISRHRDVVRIGPNELSFCTVQSYQDIYAYPSKGKQRFEKTDFYDSGVMESRTATEQTCIQSQHKKPLASALSTKSVRKLEGTVQQFIDLFIEQLGNWGNGGHKPINVTDAYNWLTFDIIGELAFSESFNALTESASRLWPAILLDGEFYALLTSIKKRLPCMRLLLPFMLPRGTADRHRELRKLTHEKVVKRMELGGILGRDDFVSHMVSNGVDDTSELIIQGSALIFAGSETAATALAAITWYLLRVPRCLAAMQTEIRSSFKSKDEITGTSVARLVYLHGVIEEGLRMFPPVVIGLPRASPGAFIDGRYIPSGVTVSSDTYSMSRDPRYWTKPEEFLPERWIGNAFSDDKRASQPFSTGPGACLGINMAYVEMKLILANIVLSYDMESVDNPVTDWNQACNVHLLWKKPELWVKFRPRAI
ncbi:hypothetical protein QQS21_004771 [Conoideocrella luteorostrata]|uniref:Cytochrome P450 n=1 Tax=Conoideocrella luteorostrata TaxID=1105319 RepID=A0AAJ0FZL3_9HYPO|nr:hypothetical protein QQS21_004771 [Conoideocrella luteorostrata]